MRVAIIGGGFSGSVLAIHLLRASAALDIVIVERARTPGRGLAYSTQNPDHLLNVRAANMSAFEDDPTHFLRWLWANDRANTVPPSGHAFVSRATYGAYIEALLRDSIAAGHSGTSVIRVLHKTAVDIAPGQSQHIVFDDGTSLPADIVVLCTGNLPPSTPTAFALAARTAAGYIADPWDTQAIARIDTQDDIVILGSGLTTADVVQTLAKRRHTGKVTITSRRGLLPHRHEETRAYPAFLKAVDIRQPLSRHLARFRAEVRAARRQGFDWRSVFDTLRPLTQALWCSLTQQERRRFMRHLRPYWDIHRHRLAPGVAATLAGLQASGQIDVHPGRLKTIDYTDGRFVLHGTRKGSDQPLELSAKWVINCSGPNCDYKQIADHLTARILARGLVRPNPVALGLDVTEQGCVIGRTGTATPGIFALGPPTRGAFWEITAVPDIRKACARLAEVLTSHHATDHRSALSH